MNISGFQYSSATKGLRQKDKIEDQHFKLVFVYPILYDRSLTKLVDTIRDFISVSMLRELFTSNSLNMIHMASQIHPLMDERGNTVNQGAIISHTKINSDPYNTAQVQSYQPTFTNEQLKHELQQKIQSKTATIKQYLDNDPRTKSFRPYVEMITMNNMIDVPVVLGTKGLDIDTATMTFILLIAISQNLSLSNKEDLAEVFRLLRQTKPEDSWKLLNNILVSKPDPTQSRLTQWFISKWNLTIDKADRAIMGSPVGSYYSKAKSSLDDTKKVLSGLMPKKEEKQTREYKDIPLQQTFALMKSVQTEADKAELNFKMVTDKNLLKSKFGLSLDKGQTQTAITSKDNVLGNHVDIKIQGVFDQLYLGFMKDINQYGSTVYNSYINAFYPKNDVTQKIDPLQVYNEMLDSTLAGPIQEFVTTVLATDVNKSLTGLSPSQADTKIKTLKNLCNTSFSDINDTFKYIVGQLRYGLDGLNFSTDTFHGYVNSLDSIAKKSNGEIASIELGLSKILSTPEITSRMTMVSGIIKKSFDSISSNLKTLDYRTINVSDISLPGTKLDSIAKLEEFRKQLILASASFIEFIFWRNVAIALCNYVSIVETSVETASSDVMDEMNFTLILPLESLVAVAHAFEAKNYRNMMNSFQWGEERPNDNNFKNMKGGGNTEHLRLMSFLNDNYIKGVIKYIVKKLQVPNVIVVDSKANKVYYRLMYMTDIYQASFSTLQTFIELTTKQTLKDNNPSGSW